MSQLHLGAAKVDHCLQILDRFWVTCKMCISVDGGSNRSSTTCHCHASLFYNICVPLRSPCVPYVFSSLRVGPPTWGLALLGVGWKAKVMWKCCFFTHVRLELKLERLVVGQGERIENYMCPIARIRWWRLVSSFIRGGGDWSSSSSRKVQLHIAWAWVEVCKVGGPCKRNWDPYICLKWRSYISFSFAWSWFLRPSLWVQPRVRAEACKVGGLVQKNLDLYICV
jgi:hypothetical protein